MGRKVVQLPHPIGQKRYTNRTQDGYAKIGDDIIDVEPSDLMVCDKNLARKIIAAHN